MTELCHKLQQLFQMQGLSDQISSSKNSKLEEARFWVFLHLQLGIKWSDRGFGNQYGHIWWTVRKIHENLRWSLILICSSYTKMIWLLYDSTKSVLGTFRYVLWVLNDELKYYNNEFIQALCFIIFGWRFLFLSDRVSHIPMLASSLLCNSGKLSTSALLLLPPKCWDHRPGCEACSLTGRAFLGSW